MTYCALCNEPGGLGYLGVRDTEEAPGGLRRVGTVSLLIREPTGMIQNVETGEAAPVCADLDACRVRRYYAQHHEPGSPEYVDNVRAAISAFRRQREREAGVRKAAKVAGKGRACVR